MEDGGQSGASEVGANSVTTVEIRVRTLDSSNYTVRVDKDLPVPALKDQLAPVVGVPPQNQRLICRGRVLKDDQLLSSYNVEDGHTLHLVPRPEASGDDTSSGRPESAGTSSRSRHAQITHSLLLGTINIPDATEGGMPDLNRILSAVLNSVGSAGATPPEGRRGVAVMQVHSGSAVPAPASTAPAEGNAGRHQTGASSTASDGFQLRSLEVPSDALTTLSHYLFRLEQVFSENGYETSGSFGAQVLSFLSRGSRSGAAAATPASPPNLPSRPLPTPAALGATINRVQQLLHGQVSAAFTDLAGQLTNEANLDDTLSRADLQANAVWNGNVMQQLGALLLELGRTTMTLRLGPSPAQAVVNSGPAIFVSPSGPNPMMVQPTPFGGFSFASPQSDIGAVSRNSGLNSSAADTGRRSSSAFQPIFQTSPDSVPEGDAASQTAEAGPGEQDSEPRLGLLLQDNGSVRIVPVRGRTASTPTTGLSFHSRIQAGIRSLRTGSGPESAIAVPVLGIRAQVHTDQQWTQAVMQASEGQRPVGIALTIPVDVAAPGGVTIPVNVSQAAAAAESGQQAPSDLDSIFAAYGVRSEAARELTPPRRPENCEHVDQDIAQSSQVEGGQNMETEGEKGDDQRAKRAGDEIAANAGEASCKATDEDPQSSEAKRRKV